MDRHAILGTVATEHIRQRKMLATPESRIGYFAFRSQPSLSSVYVDGWLCSKRERSRLLRREIQSARRRSSSIRSSIAVQELVDRP